MMHIFPKPLFFPVLFVGALCVFESCSGSNSGKENVDNTAVQKPPAAELAWRNTVDTVPAGWKGPVFTLSHDYPQSLPKGNPKEIFPWLAMKVDFNAPTAAWNAKWEAYIQSIKEYVMKGQDPNLSNELGFQTMINGSTMWYHIPWMAYDPAAGREFTHGTTNERTAHISDFVGDNAKRGLNLVAGSIDSMQGFETWAVGCYNDFGGYAIGQAWNKDGSPNFDTINGQEEVKGLPFLEGTVVVKVLFTTATPNDVPYLKGSARWDVNRHKPIDKDSFSCERQILPVHLVQMDVAVVDHRSPTNWVFGTFAYNDSLPGKTVWERLSPVGLQWGMDGESWPAVESATSKPIHQTVLDTIDIYEHDGCNKRLAGPVDNKMSSCMSCHGGAFAPYGGQLGDPGKNIPPIFGFTSMCEEVDTLNKAYFTTYKWPAKFPNGKFNNSYNLDFSLQMWVAFREYAIWNVNGSPASCN